MNKTELGCLGLLLVSGCSRQPAVHSDTRTSANSPEVQTPVQEPRLASLEQQKMCADQAKKAFEESDQSKKSKETVTPAEYVDHYDAKTNVCYVAVRGLDSYDNRKTFTTHTVLFDAFEGRVYAKYIWTSDKKKKYWEVPPLACDVTPYKQDQIVCKSGPEFDGLVDKYFGIGF